jgi:AcrR family transcriptional regulator
MPRAFSEKEKEALRERLHAAGKKAIARSGLKRLNIDELVREVGLSKGGFYLIFDSKEAFVVELFDRVEAEVRKQLETLLDEPHKRPRERLERLLRFFFEIFEKHPVMAVLANPDETNVLLRSMSAEDLAKRAADDDRYFASLFRRWQHEGWLRQVDANVLASLGRAAMAVVQQRQFIGEERMPALIDLLVESLVSHLTTRR